MADAGGTPRSRSPSGRGQSASARIPSVGSPPPSPAEKQAALGEVLRSAAFARGEQLRNFLRYICEMEVAGRAGEVSEYLVGIDALGRPPGYSTGEDSTVRRRAHDLRQKLQDVYAGELADAPLRIELPKGTYVPRFVVRAPDEEEPAPEPPPPALQPLPAAEPPSAPSGLPRAAWLAAGALAGVVGASTVFLSARSIEGVADPVLLEAWGPLAAPGGNVLLCLASPPHHAIFPYPEGPVPPSVSLLPQVPELRQWYHQHYPLQPGDRLGSHVTTGPIRLGDVHGLVTAVRTLARMGVAFQVVPEKNVSVPAVRGRNLLLFGTPEFSYAASSLLERASWTVRYDPEHQSRVIGAVRGPAPADKVYVPFRNGEGWLSEVFGLITVLPSADAPGADPLRTVIVSGTHSAGSQAAMEFFASPADMRRLRERFRAENQEGFPAAYQVVVRSRVHSAQAISSEYVTHVTLPSR